MKVAIIHEWLVHYAGAERVTEQFLQLYPDADIFSLVDFLPEKERFFIQHKPVTTSFIQNLPFAKTKFRHYLLLMPLAIEQFDLSSYDLIISNNYAVSKGVITGPNQLHISYVQSPIRYAWDLQHQYLRESSLDKGIKSWITRWILHKIRIWDIRSANGVDHFIGNSQFIARRIKKAYRREAEVIYPPVDTAAFTLCTNKEDFYMTASRMVPYKKIDAIVEAFSNMPDKKLVVIGAGPDFDKIKAKAGKNVQLLGFQPFSVLLDHMQRAKAFVFAAEEDFGITPVEAQACGTPVIAFGKGGALETVSDGSNRPATGLFFYKQTPEAICAAVKLFETQTEKYTAQACRDNALLFSPDVFRAKLSAFIEAKIKEFNH